MYPSDYVILGDIKPCAGKKISGKDQNNWESRKCDMVRRTVEYLTEFVVFDIVIKYTVQCYFSNKIIHRRDQGCKISFWFQNTPIKQ